MGRQGRTKEGSDSGAGERADRSKFRRILLLSHEMTYTGAPNSLLNVARVLRKHGHRVTVHTLEDGPFRREFLRRGFWVRRFPSDLSQFLKERYDLVIANTIFCGKQALMLQEKIPTLLYIREAQNLPDIIRDCRLDEDWLHHADYLICVSPYAGRFISRTYQPERLWMLPNFLIPPRLFRPPRNRIRDGKVHFLIAATIEPRKGIAVAVQAMKMLSPEAARRAVLDLAGRKPEWARDYWEGLELEKDSGILYHGEVTGRRRKHRLFRNANVILVPSFDESCSLTALEGAMYGKALLVTENVGAKYLARGGGLVVPTGSPQALAGAMEFLIDNCSLLEEMGRQAHENGCRMASADDYYRRLREIFQKIQEEER